MFFPTDFVSFKSWQNILAGNFAVLTWPKCWPVMKLEARDMNSCGLINHAKTTNYMSYGKHIQGGQTTRTKTTKLNWIFKVISLYHRKIKKWFVISQSIISLQGFGKYMHKALALHDLQFLLPDAVHWVLNHWALVGFRPGDSCGCMSFMYSWFVSKQTSIFPFGIIWSIANWNP